MGVISNIAIQPHGVSTKLSQLNFPTGPTVFVFFLFFFFFLGGGGGDNSLQFN